MSAITFEICGVISEGFKITVLPAAIAETKGPKVRFSGKFHGEIIRQTPLGSYTYQEEEPINTKGVSTF